jgi:hypothetical protein
MKFIAKNLLPTKYMQYGGFSAKIDVFCPMIFSDNRIFIAQSRHIAYTLSVGYFTATNCMLSKS